MITFELLVLLKMSTHLHFRWESKLFCKTKGRIKTFSYRVSTEMETLYLENFSCEHFISS